MTWRVMVPFSGTLEERMTRCEMMIFILWGTVGLWQVVG